MFCDVIRCRKNSDFAQVNDFVEFFSGDAKVSAALRNALASTCCMGHWGTKQITICLLSGRVHRNFFGHSAGCRAENL